MNKPGLHRWHFDLAIFLGLLLFGLSYWYIFPRPRSVTRIPTDPTINMSAWSLGFSGDGQFYHTIIDCNIVGNHLPKPMIQRWSVLKGELLTEYPLQVPAEDITYIKPSPRGGEHLCLETSKLPDQDVIYSRHRTNSSKEENIHRLYDLSTGECISKLSSLTLVTDLWYLLKNPLDGHHWGCYVKTYELDQPIQFVDLTTGITIHTLPADKNMRMFYVSLSKDHHYVFILWSGPLKQQKNVQPVLGIYCLGTWECIQKITLPLQPYGLTRLDTRQPDFIEIKYLTALGKEQQVSGIRLRKNSHTKLFEQEGEVSIGSYQDEILSWQRSFRQEYETISVEQRILNDKHKPPEQFLTINNFLNRFGITIWRSRTEQEYYVYDLKSGELLRQLTGLTEFENNPLQADPTGRYLIGVKSTEGRNWISDYWLYVYEIPNQLWERSLRAIMYLSWLLILPWPFRYLIRSAR